MLYIATWEQVLNNIPIMCTFITVLANRRYTVMYVSPLVAMYVKYVIVLAINTSVVHTSTNNYKTNT